MNARQNLAGTYHDKKVHNDVLQVSDTFDRLMKAKVENIKTITLTILNASKNVVYNKRFSKESEFEDNVVELYINHLRPHLSIHNAF